MWELPSGLIIIFLFCFYFNNFFFPFKHESGALSCILHCFVFILGIRVRTEIRKELCPCGTGLTHAITTGWKEGPGLIPEGAALKSAV